jgi:hypothetical protein
MGRAAGDQRKRINVRTVSTVFLSEFFVGVGDVH